MSEPKTPAKAVGAPKPVADVVAYPWIKGGSRKVVKLTRNMVFTADNDRTGAYAGIQARAGQTVDAPADVADKWIRNGKAV